MRTFYKEVAELVTVRLVNTTQKKTEQKLKKVYIIT
jgi:hypothetical protein